MKRVRWFLAITAIFVGVSLAYGGTVSWTLPTHYTDNTVIDSADIATMVTTVYQGDTPTGPWSAIGVSAPGAESWNGSTARNRHYTATSGWDNNVSDFAVPFFYPRGKPNPPTGVGAN